VTEKRKLLGIILSGSFAGFMILLDANILNIALPYIGKYFNAGTSLVIQLPLLYLLVLASSMVIVGKLAEKAGIKRLFIYGFIIFTLSSLMSAFSPSFYFLLLFRAVQATGAAMLIVTAITIITTFIPAEKRGWGFGILAPVISLGGLLGAPLGGLITGLLSWHWIFLVNIPIGILAIITARKVIPDDPARSGNQKIFTGFDYPGAILSFFGLALLVYFMNQGRKIGWTSPITLGGMMVAISLLVLFYFVEKKRPDPLLDMSIFRNRNFSLAILASFLAYGFMTGSNVLMPFYLVYMLHVKVEYSGFILVIFTLVFSLLSPLSGRLSDRIPKTRLTSLGMFSLLLSSLFFIYFLPRTNLIFAIAFLVLMGMSFALFIPPNNNLVMSLAAGGKQSISSSVFKLFTTLASLFGVLIMEAMFTFCLPSSSESTLRQLHKATRETLLTGFQYSYLGGCILVFTALVVSLLIRAKHPAPQLNKIFS
jgi:EmrB/QacA subfamily drug resistance transporter